MALLATLLGGVCFGLALAAPPGPMNAVIAAESALRGWGAGVRAGLGAMTADACFLMLALAGAVTVVEQSPRLRRVLFVGGGLLMLYFAYDAVADAGSFADADESEGNGFRKAFLLAVTNPYQILFWLTVGVGLLRPGTIDVLDPLPIENLPSLVVETGSPTLLVGLFAGIAVWITAFPAAIAGGRRRVNTLAPIVAWASALVLGGFGLVFLASALT